MAKGKVIRRAAGFLLTHTLFSKQARRANRKALKKVLKAGTHRGGIFGSRFSKKGKPAAWAANLMPVLAQAVKENPGRGPGRLKNVKGEKAAATTLREAVSLEAGQILPAFKKKIRGKIVKTLLSVAAVAARRFSENSL